MEAKFDLISIGDSTIDLFLTLESQDVEAVCSLDVEKCVIAFDYGSKIPVSSMTKVVGVGNAANNAVGASRLGLKVAIYSVIGSDKDSQDIKRVFNDEDVSTEFVIEESDKRSNLSVVLNYSGERTIFVYHEDRRYFLPNLPKTNWVYYTSVGKNHLDLNREVVDYVKKTGAKLGFNPGSYQLRSGKENLKPIIEIADVLSVNREEAQMITQGDLDDIGDLFEKLKKMGTKLVVITDGRNGSYASFDGREIWHTGVPEKSPVVERTGCGDAYTSAFIAARIMGKEIPEAMVWGTMNATSVIQYIGAREGLLTRVGIDKFIGMYGEYVKPKMI